MSDYKRHRGHLVGMNKEHEPQCFQCGEEIYESGFYAFPYSGFGCPTNGKPDVMSPTKPPIADYFYKDEDDKGEID